LQRKAPAVAGLSVVECRDAAATSPAFLTEDAILEGLRLGAEPHAGEVDVALRRLEVGVSGPRLPRRGACASSRSVGAAVGICKTLLASRDSPSRSTSSATRGGRYPTMGAGRRSLSATPTGRVWSTGPDDCSRSFKGLVRQA
jgi:hypothetical protein